MEGHLRIKVVAITGAALMIVLGTLIAVVSMLGYANVASTADEILGVLEDNGGRFPSTGMPQSLGMSQEVPYESRFFFVAVDDNGDVIDVDTDNIFLIDDSHAVSYAKQAWRQSSGQDGYGFVDTYRYSIRHIDQGGALFIFLDCGRMFERLSDFVFASVIASIAGCAAVVIVVAILSRKIIHPIIETYHKQRQFITDAGHELKTPLTVISADTELLAIEVGNDNEWIGDIKGQIKRLTSLVNDLIFLAKTEEGGIVTKTMVDFSKLVADEVDPFDGVAKAGGKELSINVTNDIWLNGDEHGLRTLVSVLIDNALKYSVKGSTVSVTLVRKHMFQCQLTIENESDHELDPKTLPNMFDRFYRADESHNSSTGGYGIGLSIASAVASAHGGRIVALTDKSKKKLIMKVTLPMSLFKDGERESTGDGK